MNPDRSMMKGSDWLGENPAGWTASEKFDGYFARWTGERLLSREGVNFNAPEWFTAGLPGFALDCELFAGYGERPKLANAARWADGERWRAVELIVFDTPGVSGNYQTRHAAMDCHVATRAGLRLVQWRTVSGRSELIDMLAKVQGRGGEGLVMRHPHAPYTVGRVRTMLKVKTAFV